MLRLATSNDLECLYEMAYQFYQQTDYQFPIDEEYGKRYLVGHLSNPNCISLLLEVQGNVRGCMLGFAAPHPFSPMMMANEIVWWVDPAFRTGQSLTLFKAFEYWAIEKMKCEVICMSSSTSTSPKLESYYRRCGYMNKEKTWYKEVNQHARI